MFSFNVECVETCPAGAVVNTALNLCYWDSGSSQGSFTEAAEHCRSHGLSSSATLLQMKTADVQDAVKPLTLYVKRSLKVLTRLSAK